MMRRGVAAWLARVPGVGTLARRALARLKPAATQPVVLFAGSADYWRQRYAAGGDSGAGSYGKFAQFKARLLNELFAELRIESVVEFGCGDGNQLELLRVPQYLGVDVSVDAIARCRQLFAATPGRRFVLADDYVLERADCALSLDVIYHLVEDNTFDAYMQRLFAAATRCVVVYSSNRVDEQRADGAHVRHRVFTDWVAAREPGWVLWRHVPNEHPYQGDYRSGSFADFYIYRRRGESA